MTDSNNKRSFYKEGRGYWSIYPDLCQSCGICKQRCPKRTIKWSEQLSSNKKPVVEVDIRGCIFCRVCEKMCPESAIKIEREAKFK